MTDEQSRAGAESPKPRVTESDPSGDGPHGLSGDMGVSSERTGRVPGGQGEATHGAADPYPELPTEENPPAEQSIDEERPPS